MLDDIKPVSPTKTPVIKPGSASGAVPTSSNPEVLITAQDETSKDTSLSSGAGNSKKSPFAWISHHKKPAVIGAVVAIIILGGGIGAVVSMRKKPAPSVVKKTQTTKKVAAPVAKPIVYTSALTGAVVTKEAAARPVTAIMIENSMDARPQSGLLDAGVVFEAIAEGGITRFLTLFQEGQPGYIGPVRSVRPYFVDWLRPFDTAVAHVGGSKDALDMLKALNAKDLDQFTNPAPYHRISSRYAPHNVYTSMAELDALSTSKGFTSSTFTNWPRKPDAFSKTPTTTQIDLSISSPLFNVHYDYDAATGKYNRSEGGKAHTDEKSGAQLTPSVVIAMVVPYRSITASDGNREQYDTVGTGPAIVFQDGTAAAITWTKKERDTQIAFTDAAGKPVAFNVGQTWITVLGDSGDISYK